MPFKLIGTIILVVLVAILTGFNLSNKCTIWFFHNFENIPVFAALLGSFIAGVIITIPFTLYGRRKKDKKNSKKTELVNVTREEKSEDKE
ncbi:hypothetical protein [Treponema sp.]|uniref:hypothetical protein n=1 Tax=Treponema sp. TaxID=166 RepID=UPI001D4EF7B9|nr:hypothetical protein [Treponema sp.]MBS7242542.1 hypothetical protein [Treponema sp.]MCI6442805.1 hypothetical protein [Spirochaetia bacterium]MDY4131667.1 hypothetical protein [Treponema sp.]